MRRLLLAAVALLALAVPARAARHMKLTRAEPEQRGLVTASPTAIRLWFSEPVDAATSKITVGGPSGTVPLGPVTREAGTNAPLVAKVEGTLVDGPYVVAWKAMSKDGHVVNGRYGFTVALKK